MFDKNFNAKEGRNRIDSDNSSEGDHGPISDVEELATKAQQVKSSK